MSVALGAPRLFLQSRRHSRRYLRRALASTFAYSLLVLVALAFFVPFLWLVVTALKPLNQVFTIPPIWVPRPVQWQNFRLALTHPAFPFLRLFWNSLYYAVFSTLGVTAASCLAAYAFARIDFPGRTALFAITLGTLMIPGVVTMVPTYLIFKWLGWIGTYRPLIIPAWTGNPFFIFMLRQFMMTLPQELSDAAKVDGASELEIFYRIMLPLMRSAVLVVVLFNFMWSWNDFMGPLIYLNNARLYPLSLGLYAFLSREGIKWNLLAAAALVTTVPVIVLFFVGQQQFIEGITMTGIKR
jgi:multiple sugar transport system permease protein